MRVKKKLIWASTVLVLLLGSFSYEWSYSDDMQEHIAQVNLHLEMARTNALVSSGLFGSLQTMTAEADVAREIIETNEHVHSLKDEVLAWKIKKTVQQCDTLGETIQAVIAKWPESI